MSTPEPEDGPRDSSARLEDCDWEQIADYVAHRATLAERAALEARMARDAAFRVHVERARLAWERARDALDRPTTPAEFARACRQLAAQLDEPVASLLRAARAPAMSAAAGEPPPARAPIVLPRRRERVPRWRVTAMAATVVLGVGVGATWLALRESAPPPLREIATARGERLTVPLDDGSRVVLAPGSRLTVPERFARDARTVTLAGHAYFEVAPEAARPFLVQTPGAVVRVLGTAFDLRAHEGSGTAQLVVRSGRVSIRAVAAPVAEERVVVPGERATVEADGAVRVERGVDVDDALAWTSGRLVFERTPLSEVVAEIERWRDVRIDVASEELGRRRLTASFEHEPLEVVLQVVSHLVGARVARDSLRFFILPRNEPQP